MKSVRIQIFYQKKDDSIVALSHQPVPIELDETNDVIQNANLVYKRFRVLSYGCYLHRDPGKFVRLTSENDDEMARFFPESGRLEIQNKYEDEQKLIESMFAPCIKTKKGYFRNGIMFNPNLSGRQLPYDKWTVLSTTMQTPTESKSEAPQEKKITMSKPC